MYIPSQIDIASLIDAAETISTDDDIPEYISYRLLKEAQERLLLFGPDENAARLHDRISQIFVRLKVDQECPEKFKEMSLIEILVDIYLEYDYKNKIDRVEGSSEKSERFLTPSKVLTALKMLIRVERGDTKEEDTESDDGYFNITESSSTASTTDLQASRVNANMYIPSQIDIESLIDAARKACEEGLPEFISYRLFREAQQKLLDCGPDDAARLYDLICQIFVRLEVDEECPEKYEEMSLIEILVDIYLEYDYKNKIDRVEGSSETREKFLTTSKLLRTALKMLIRVERGDTSEETELRRSYGFQANMDVPISKSDIEYLIDAAEKTSFDDDIPKYIPYRLFKEARETLVQFMNYQSLLIGPAENTEKLKSRIYEGLSRITRKRKYLPKRPEGYSENESIIQVLVQFYRRYNKTEKIDKLHKEYENHKKYKKYWGFLSPNFQGLRKNFRRKEILRTSKALRTALKMLCRAERGDTSEEVFIQENEIPNEFLQDTEYDEDATYNIIPFDDRPDLLPQVKEAIDSLKWDIEAESSPTRGRDVLDCLQKFFGFQESSVSNQRENIVNLLSNEQMRPFIPGEHGTAFEDALENVFLKSLDNYIKWCIYLRIEPIWNNMDDENRKKKRILYISLYYLIWGEAANVRFLPECLCYIFHHMSKQLDDEYFILVCEQLDVQHVSGSFIDQVILPLYEVIAAEAKINSKRDVSHSKWRNYDDFNEYFWSPDCLQLGWPLNINSPFLQKPPEGSTTVFGKTSFVERRTFLHLYHSFHRMWIFHVIMFQALAIFAFSDENLNSKMLRKILIVGPTYFLMKLIQSMLDIWLKDGAYCRTSRVDVLRIRFRIICFTSTLIIFFLGMKFLQEKTSPVEESIVFYACIVVLVIYACIIKWINQLEVYVVRRMDEELLDSCLKEEYVGRGMDEKPTDYNKYMVFWIVTLAFNIAYTYCYLIRPLVRPTRDITDVSKNIHNMLAIGSLWASAICAYIVGSHVSYNVTSAVVGTFVGHKDRLGNIKFLGDVHKCFDKIPTAFMDHLHTPLKIRESPLENDQEDVKKLNAAEFSPFWNKIVMNLREEDYISDMEQIALSMPEKSGYIDVIQWPLFLLVGKVSLAIKIAAKPISQEDMWDEISRDVYMKYAVEECFHSVMFILSSVLNNEVKEWVDGIYDGIKRSIKEDGNLGYEFQLKLLESFVEKISELTGIMQKDLYYVDIVDREILKNNAKKLLNNVIQHNFLGENKFAGEQIPFSDSDSQTDLELKGGSQISDFNWPTDPELRLQIERLHLLLTMDKSADHVLRNREARRRLKFFTNSLFMSMPKPKPVRKMLSFSVLTPYYEETVIYSKDELESRNDDGVTLIDYLKNLYPDEWMNYCERIDGTYHRDAYQLRLWASYRGQTLARTVRGTMYYQKALLLQAYREMLIAVGLGEDGQTSTSPVPDVPMDEDMLKSLEKRSSNGEILKHTFRIHLRGEKNYNPWKEYMIKMLELQTTTDFVDPKGESQVKYVRNYPQKWKKLDKKVKDWIMASLDDPLKNMVKEMKTAKELWETLKIFFTRDTDEISSVNVTEHVSIKLLNKDHYREWVSQMENFLQAKGMFGYINGKLKDPDPKGKSHLESVKIYSPRWKELDGQVKEWIRVSLSESMYDAVKDSETAEQMWDALKEIIGSQCLDYAKAHVDLKFTYVVSCQIYGKQKSEGKDVAADIAFLLKKNEGLRVAFIDEVNKEFYSKLVKADKNGKDMEVYSIKLPGDPILGEGKPENQNHAIVFTRGNAIQTIDMNQDNYFEETLKMRNLLEEFHRKDDVIHPPTILGIREHIFTGSASSLASFMSNQETGFVTLGQRVIANPLKVRMHYGHPDVFDRVFHITRGGISKASRGINISEDIYAGFNSTLRQGSVTHHEYIQVGKGRDVGFNQIATFEGKVAGGNGEQVLSRDLYRLGQRSDFFRMLSFYYTTVGYYFSSLLMVITLYILLYGNLIMALSGTRVPHALNDTDMAPEWFLMIVLLPAIYMLLVPYLEQGLEKAVESFLAMFFSLGSIFFAFSLGTRIHWFGRTIIHGGASYQATGRGFVLHHIKFSENYRLYSRSHFVKGMEVLFLLVVYCIYGFHSVRAIYNNLLLFGGLILSISWIVAPFLFDSSPFDLKKNSKDWEDWNNWLNRKTDEVKKIRIEDKVKESWEIWWTTELSHIRTTEGRVIETILSLRFFIFPLVVGYKLDMQGLKNSLSNCVIPWIFLVGILFAHEFFSNKKFSNNRVATIGALALAIAYYFAFGNMLAFTIAIITIVLGFISFFSNNRVATIGALAIAYYYSAFGGVLAFFIAIITTVWGFLSICVAWKPTLKRFSLWMPVKYLAWICDTRMPALPFNVIDSDECVALKRMLEIFSLWTPVTYLAWICDTGMGALMFKIANMFSQRSIKQYLLRNMFVHNVSELLHKSSPENAPQYGIGC